jgi:hypothetical protein
MALLIQRICFRDPLQGSVRERVTIISTNSFDVTTALVNAIGKINCYRVKSKPCISWSSVFVISSGLAIFEWHEINFTVVFSDRVSERFSACESHLAARSNCCLSPVNPSVNRRIAIRFLVRQRSRIGSQRNSEQVVYNSVHANASSAHIVVVHNSVDNHIIVVGLKGVARDEKSYACYRINIIPSALAPEATSERHVGSTYRVQCAYIDIIIVIRTGLRSHYTRAYIYYHKMCTPIIDSARCRGFVCRARAMSLLLLSLLMYLTRVTKKT